MRKQIVIIGATPLCLFLVEALDQSVARLVHVDVRWLTGPGDIVQLALKPTVLGTNSTLKPKKIDHVRVGRVAIKSISLPDRRIITDKGVINYDWLLIDQGQAMTDVGLKAIRQEVKKLVATVQAAINTSHKTVASITIGGNGANAAQLLLSLSQDLKANPAAWKQIELVASDLKLADRVSGFIKSAGVILSAKKSDHPGLKVATALPLIANAKIRGLKIDRSGRAVTDESGIIEKYPEVTILDSADRPWQSLLTFERTLAAKITGNIDRYIEAEGHRPLELNGRATLLAGEKLYVQLGKMGTGGIRARAIRALERSLLSKRG